LRLRVFTLCRSCASGLLTTRQIYHDKEQYIKKPYFVNRT
jgi:hypothetical protein